MPQGKGLRWYKLASLQFRERGTILKPDLPSNGLILLSLHRRQA